MSRLDSVDATSVYGVSVDSRSRPPEQPDNKYTIDLGRTLDRVKSIQLGAFQLPDCRYAFDKNARLLYIEPITIPPLQNYIFIEQTVTTLNKKTNELTAAVNTVNILVPPTLNPIVDYIPGGPNADDVVVTQYDAGARFGAAYYPLIGQHMSVVGAHFPQSLMSPAMAPFPSQTGPVLAAATLSNAPTYTGPGPANIDNSFQYASNYLDTLTTSAGNYNSRHILPGVATSYVSAPRPTLVELFTMLNVALADQMNAPTVTATVANATNTAPIIITTTAPHGLHNYNNVTVSGVAGNTGANGTFFIAVTSTTTFSLQNSTGTGVYTPATGSVVSVQSLQTLVQFGFNDEQNSIIATGPTRVLIDNNTTRKTVSLRFVSPPATTSLTSYLGFGLSRLDPPASAAVPNFIVRSVAIRQGNYAPDQLVAMMNTRMNPLLFADADAATRTLNYLLPGGGAPASVVIPVGSYTGTQLAAYLNFYMAQPAANISVTFDPDAGAFTFTQNVGLTFTLVFGTAASAAVALRLGFEPVNYSGTSTYTSVMPAVYGVTDPLLQPYPSNTYFLSADTTQNHFTFDTGDAVNFKTQNGVNTPNVSAVWEPTPVCGTVSDGIALRFVAGDVLFAQAPFASGTVTDVAAATPGDPTSVALVTTGAAHNLNTGDSVSIACVAGPLGLVINGSWTATVVAANTFTLDESAGYNAAGTATFVTGSTATFYSNSFNGTATNVYTVVVQSSWDASNGIGQPPGAIPATLTLQPTVSIFSVLDAATVNEALGTPAATRPVYLQDASRSVFQLLFGHPDARPANFGFPAISWPPSSAALQQFDPGAFSTYSAARRAVPVAPSYTSPFCYNLLPPDYIIMLLVNPTGSRDAQTHTFGAMTKPIFAKLYITSPFLQISEQMVHSTFAGFQRINSVTVEFQNPDGSPVQFNGRPHSFSLLFTLFENAAETTCL